MWNTMAMVLPEERTCVPSATEPQNLCSRGASSANPFRTYKTESTGYWDTWFSSPEPCHYSFLTEILKPQDLNLDEITQMIIHFLIKNENLKHGFVEHGSNINSHQHSQKHRRYQTLPAAGHQWLVLADGPLELSAPSDTHGYGGKGWGNWEMRWFQKQRSALLHRLQKKKNLFSNCLLHSTLLTL